MFSLNRTESASTSIILPRAYCAEMALKPSHAGMFNLNRRESVSTTM